MSNTKDQFVQSDERMKSTVQLGNGGLAIIEGKGSVGVQIQTGEIKKIIDVSYVPTLAHNLLSVGQLVRKGYKVLFDTQGAHIKHQETNTRQKLNPTNSLPYKRLM